jgi:hypothetical protein
MNRTSILTVITLLLTTNCLIRGEISNDATLNGLHPEPEIGFSCKPLTEKDRLSARKTFHITSGVPIRFWGITFSCGDNFPTHEDAARIAGELASHGINSVRFDKMGDKDWPHGIWDPDGGKLHPEALDRLDYFIGQLADHGIYSSIVLPVNRLYRESPILTELPEYSIEITSFFSQELINLQKESAQELLKHENKYRGNLTYADDHAVASVQITDESLFMDRAEDILRSLPASYAAVLQKQYNEYLQKKYGTTEKMTEAWQRAMEPSSDNLLKSPAFSEISPDQIANWIIEKQPRCTVQLEVSNQQNNKNSIGSYLKIKPGKSGTDENHLKLKQTHLQIQKGQRYTLTFKGQSYLSARTIRVGVYNEINPDSDLGLNKPVPLRTQTPARKFRYDFVATDTCNTAEIVFAFGKNPTDFYLSEICLFPVNEFKLADGITIEKKTVSLYSQNEQKAQRIDRLLFLAETQKAYYENISNFLRQTLGCNALIAGSRHYHPLDVWTQESLSFLIRNWDNPEFPEKPAIHDIWTPSLQELFDSENKEHSKVVSTINRTMENKPHVIYERNIQTNNHISRFPIIAAYAASEELDGVYVLNTKTLNKPLSLPEKQDAIGSMQALHTGAYIFQKGLLKTGYYVESGYSKKLNIGRIEYKNHGDYQWFNIKEHTLLHARSESVILLSGHICYFNNLATDFLAKNSHTYDIFLATRDHMPENLRESWPSGTPLYISSIVDSRITLSSPEIATIILISLDEKPFDKSAKILIAAFVSKEFLNSNPVEEASKPIDGMISIPALSRNNTVVTCNLLNADSMIKKEIGVVSYEKTSIIPLSFEEGSIWCLMERKQIN